MFECSVTCSGENEKIENFKKHNKICFDYYIYESYKIIIIINNYIII